MLNGSAITFPGLTRSRSVSAFAYFFYFLLLTVLILSTGWMGLLDFPGVLLLIVPYALITMKSPITGLALFIFYHLSELKGITPAPGSFLSVSILAEICLLVALVFRFFLTRKGPRFRTSIPLLTSIYLGFYLAAAVWRSSLSPKAEGLKSVTLLFFLFICIIAFADSREKIVSFLRSLVVLQLFWFGAAAYHVLRYGTQTLASRASVEQGYLEKIVGVDALAVSVLMFLPLVYSLLSLKQPDIWRFLTQLSLWLSLITVILTFSRNGFVNLIVVLSLIFLRRVSSPRVLSFILILILLVALAPSSYWSRMSTITSLEVESGLRLKISHIQRGLDIVRSNPLLGIGLGRLVRAVHNTLLQVAVELGLPVLGLFLALLYHAFRETKRARLLWSEKDGKFWYSLTLMLSIGLIAFLIGGLTISLTRFLPFIILLALVVSVRNLSPEPTETSGMRA